MVLFYLYILKCRDGSYYIGHTEDLEKRMAEHKGGKGGSYTSARLPIEVMYVEEFQHRDSALEAERKLKKWTRKKKEIVIKEGWEALRGWKSKK